MDFKPEQLGRAENLLSAAQANAISMYLPLTEKFSELREIGKAGLYEYWDYFITIASVGLAFMEIADSFKGEQDIDSVVVAVQKALNEWEKHLFELNNYDFMCNFLDTFNELQKEGLPLDVSVGAWIWINLKGSERATERLKEIAQQEFYAKLQGHMAITTFHNWWKSEGE